MKKIWTLFQTEAVLYTRDFFGFFFTFVFPSLMLILFGSIYGNEPSPQFNGLGTIDVSIPGYLALIVGVTGLMSFPLTLSTYKDKKIYKRFDATPAGKGTIIAVQAFVNLIMTLIGAVILLTVAKLVYNIQVQGSWIFIGLCLLLSVATIFSLGFLFTAIAPTLKISNILCYSSYFLMIFLSGATMPRFMFPENIKRISDFLPLTHSVNVLEGTFKNTPLSEYQNSLIILFAVMALCTLIGAIMYKKKSWS